MNKDNLKKLIKYQQKLQLMLDSGITEKHKNHPKTYLQFLNRELQAIKIKISSIKLEG